MTSNVHIHEGSGLISFHERYIVESFSKKELGWKQRRKIKKHWPSDYENYGLTPYGYSVVLGMVLLQDVMRNPEPWTERLGCPPDLLLQTVISEIEEWLFKGEPSIVQAPEGDKFTSEYEASDVISSMFAIRHLLTGIPQPPFHWRFVAFVRHGLNISNFDDEPDLEEFFVIWVIFLSTMASIDAYLEVISDFHWIGLTQSFKLN